MANRGNIVHRGGNARSSPIKELPCTVSDMNINHIDSSMNTEQTSQNIDYLQYPTLLLTQQRDNDYSEQGRDTTQQQLLKTTIPSLPGASPDSLNQYSAPPKFYTPSVSNRVSFHDLTDESGTKQSHPNISSGTSAQYEKSLSDHCWSSPAFPVASLPVRYPVVTLSPLSASPKVVLQSKKPSSKKPSIARYQRWTREEDDKLKQAVEEAKLIYGKNLIAWKYISINFFQGVRTEQQCRSRYGKFLDPTFKLGHFDRAEDAQILKLHNEGKEFHEIAKLLRRRPQLVRDRYLSTLDPKLIKRPWTDNEKERLYHHVHRLGPKWKQIATFFKGRSGVACKNTWFNAQISKKRRARRQHPQESCDDLESNNGKGTQHVHVPIDFSASKEFDVGLSIVSLEHLSFHESDHDDQWLERLAQATH